MKYIGRYRVTPMMVLPCTTPKAMIFNIVKGHSLCQRPPKWKELARACKRTCGLGIWFYYSRQNQDWTFPGGNGGPRSNKKKAKDGELRTIISKISAFPQGKEIVNGIWGYCQMVFGLIFFRVNMEKKYVAELVDVGAQAFNPMLWCSGRVQGHGIRRL